MSPLPITSTDTIRPRRRLAKRLLGVLFVLGALGACRGDREPDAMPADTLQVGAQPMLSEAELLHALIVGSEAGTAYADRGTAAAEHVDVETFAQVVRADHAALRENYAELANRSGVSPTDNAVSRDLRAASQRGSERLDGLAGPAFDEAFLQSTIEFYQVLLDAIDSRLLASAREQQLRTTLRNARPTYEAHLQRALQLRAERRAARDREAAAPPPQPRPAPPPTTPAPPTPPPPPDTLPVVRDTIPTARR
jgi:putative membrane protein